MAIIKISKNQIIDFERDFKFKQMQKLNELLTEDARKIYAAILAASVLLLEDWIEMCYKELGLHNDYDISNTIKLKTIDEFFKNEAIEFLDRECAESCILGGEKPSEVIGILLKYNF